MSIQVLNGAVRLRPWSMNPFKLRWPPKMISFLAACVRHFRYHPASFCMIDFLSDYVGLSMASYYLLIFILYFIRQEYNIHLLRGRHIRKIHIVIAFCQLDTNLDVSQKRNSY